MPTTWYVNLDADPRNHRGPEIPVSVTRSIVTSYNAGRSVRWTCAPGPRNLNTVAADASWVQGTAPNTQQSDTSEIGSTRTFKNRLQIPPYGNETYTVTAKRSDKPNNSLTEQFDIKRRIYFIANWMNDEGKRLFDVALPEVQRIYGALGVELERVARQSIPERGYLTDLQPLVANRPAPPRAKVGLLLRLALIRAAYSNQPREIEVPLVDGTGAGVLGADTVEDHNGTWQLTLHLPPEPGVAPGRRLVLPEQVTANIRLVDYNAYSGQVQGWFSSMMYLPNTVTRIDDRSFRVRIQDTDKPNNANLTRLAGIHTDRVQNHLPADPLDYSYFSRHPLNPTVRLQVEVGALRPVGGFSSGANIALTQDMSMYYPNGTIQQKGLALARVFAHEIAHSFGMVMQNHTYNGAQQAHGNWYNDDNGGRGDHCHTNAHTVNNTALAAGEFYYPDNPNCHQVYIPNGNNICIMFHQRTAYLHGLEFCQQCKDFIRAQDLSRNNLTAIRSWDRVY